VGTRRELGSSATPAVAAAASAGPAVRVRGWVGRWARAFAVYSDRRMLVILLMGFSSGLPLPLTLSTLSYWLAKVGVDKTAIGLFALVGLPYSLKFVWAPAIDHVRIPGLGVLLGRRRSWALATQLALAASIFALGATEPAAAPIATAAAALAVAFLSASQDIVIDAYRIEVLREHEQGAGAAATQLGYRIGMLASTAGAIALSDVVSWFAVTATLAALLGVGVVAVLLAPEPHRADGAAPLALDWHGGTAALVRARLREAVIDPFRDFMHRAGWLRILAFAVLYKFGDAIGGVMANPFSVALGFTGVEIASITKVTGLFATLAGVVVGGALVARYGLFRALVVGGVLQAATNLLFAAQARVGHSVGFLALTIAADSFTGGLGSAALVAYLSSLCSTAFTGTQYALLTSFVAQGRTVLSSGGGWLADRLDWPAFFVATTLLAVPGLVLITHLERTGRRRAAAR
jgi:PAT family beta-lactamase induction signal transducer AmpG